MSKIKAGTTSTTAYQVEADTTGTLVLQTGASPTTALTIDTSQNVGIGTVPSYKFDVLGPTSRFYFDSASNTVTLDGNGTNRDLTFYARYASSASLQTDGYWIFKTNNTERMRLDSGGNLLVGMTSGTYKVDVTDNSTGTQMRLSSSSGNGCSMNFTSTSTNGRAYRIGSNFATGAGEFAFYDATAAAERMRINSSGSVLVGTTAYSSGVGSAGFTSVKTDSGWFAAGFSGYYGVGINAISATGALMYFYYNGNGSPIGSISTNGSSTTYATSSDYRLKENVQPMTGALAKVAAMKPCTYTWKSTGAADEGFIAHELQEVCPSAVTGEKDGVEIYVDEDGNEQTRPKYQGIDTSFLVATLTAAIQELNAKVDAQAAEIAALKGQ